MTRARDVANVLSTATALATDSETAAAISSHATASNGHISYGNTAGRPASPITGQVYSNTETDFMEVYTGETYGWEQIGGISSSPSSVTATDQGSGRAYNNGQASIAFTPGSILGRSYAVTSSPGGFTASGSSSPLTVTGLQSNTSYTFTATSTNNYGQSAASAASAGVTATTVPQAPTIGTATGANTQASVTFSAGATGGSAITGFTVTSSPGNITASGASSPITVTGLTNGTAYTFTATATNANGISAASAASNGVTPIGDPKATGGTTVNDGTYWYHTFPVSGTFTPTQSITADCLVVGGGGGATFGKSGTYYGAPGGGSNVQTFSSQSLTAQNYTVTIGAGGGGAGYALDVNGSNGNPSQFGSLSAVTGGYGAVVATGYGGTSGNGNLGGSPNGASTGGGGGAGAVGANATGAGPGNGGNGLTTSLINEFASATGSGELVSSDYYFGGGGGGATGGSGGFGGAGDAKQAGTVNTGGGAGGGEYNTYPALGGGSGIVIVRYPV